MKNSITSNNNQPETTVKTQYAIPLIEFPRNKTASKEIFPSLLTTIDRWRRSKNRKNSIRRTDPVYPNKSVEIESRANDTVQDVIVALDNQRE